MRYTHRMPHPKEGSRISARHPPALITREPLVIQAYEKPGRPSCSGHEHQAILDAAAVFGRPAAG